MLDGWPGEKLLIRIWDTFEKGVGSAFLPHQIKREERARAQARRNEMLLIAQTERDVEDLRAGTKTLDDRGRLIPSLGSGTVQAVTPATVKPMSEQPPWLEKGRVLASVQSEVVARELQRLANLSKMRIYAEEEAEGVANEEISDTPVDPDWFTRWREGAQAVSAEQLQRLWARILAGELKQPGSYSLHTIDYLRRINKDEAENIANIARLVIAGTTIYTIEWNLVDIKFIDFIRLEEIGILNGVSGGFLNTLTSSKRTVFEKAFPCYNKVLLVRHENPDQKLILNCYLLSRVGRELVTLGHFAANEIYLAELGKSIKNKGYSVQLCDLIHCNTGEIVAVNASPL